VDIEGLASYIRAPQLADQTERGAFMGKRIDTVTYLCEQAGVFEIPELSVRWWDPVEGAWHHREFPAVQLEVAVNPLLIADSASWTIDELPAEWTDWVWRAAGMVILLLLLIKLAPGVLRRYLGWLEHWSHTEPAYWNRLLKAFKKAEPAQLYGALNQWLGLLGLATTHISMQLDADVSDQLAAECIGLQQNLVGMGAHWNANIFRDELTRFRRCKRSTAGSKLNHALPPLNPTRTALG
jgi:hypothetical protein